MPFRIEIINIRVEITETETKNIQRFNGSSSWLFEMINLRLKNLCQAYQKRKLKKTHTLSTLLDVKKSKSK